MADHLYDTIRRLVAFDTVSANSNLEAAQFLADRLESAGYVQRLRDPRDRRKVIVQLNVERLGELAPLYLGISQAMDAVFARYSDRELAIIADFATRAGRAAQEEIARLRALPPTNTA